MNNYKYHLDKSSKKFSCPNCNKKRFVKYIEAESGYFAEDHFGRCDREIECGYHLYPKDNGLINNEFTRALPIKKIEPSYFNLDIQQKTMAKYEINPLVNYLISQYDYEEVILTIKKYQVGTSQTFDGSTIYWQKDNNGKVRSGKLMKYDPLTGKRSKNMDGNGIITWAHSVLKIPDFKLKQCLFGLHLFHNDTKQVAIVESEKTAIIMSLELPQYVWMATGSLQGFKYELLEPIKSSQILAYPDKGGYVKWSEKANELNKKGFSIEVSKIIEKYECKEGSDLADLLEKS